MAHSLETQLITRPQGSGSMTCLDADPNDLMVSPGPIPCPLPANPNDASSFRPTIIPLIAALWTNHQQSLYIVYLPSQTRFSLSTMYIPNLQGVVAAGLAISGGLIKRASHLFAFASPSPLQTPSIRSAVCFIPSTPWDSIRCLSSTHLVLCVSCPAVLPPATPPSPPFPSPALSRATANLPSPQPPKSPPAPYSTTPWKVASIPTATSGALNLSSSPNPLATT